MDQDSSVPPVDNECSKHSENQACETNDATTETPSTTALTPASAPVTTLNATSESPQETLPESSLEASSNVLLVEKTGETEGDIHGGVGGVDVNAVENSNGKKEANEQNDENEQSGDGNQPCDGELGSGAVEGKKLSKNQLKRQRRWERSMEVKKRRKLQDKEAKVAKAKAQGRDLEAERKEQMERFLSGENRMRKQEKWRQEKMPLVEKSFEVCLDCSFEEHMTAKEITSLASQIRYCYGNNRRNQHPCKLTVTSAHGPTLQHLKNVSGFEEWFKWAFTSTEKPLEEYYDKTAQSKVVYLTSDSTNTLHDLDDSKIYVIGGIVDRNRLKKATINRAEKLGLSTARLPLDENLLEIHATRVLTCNHVFDILLHYRLHRDWKKALIHVLPKRKDAKIAGSDGDDDGNDAAEEEGNIKDIAVN